MQFAVTSLIFSHISTKCLSNLIFEGYKAQRFVKEYKCNKANGDKYNIDRIASFESIYTVCMPYYSTRNTG